MPTNPYSTPKEFSQPKRPPLQITSAEVWLGRVACGILFVFASLYLAALIFDPPGDVTLTGMLGFSSARKIIAFKVVYTAGLLTTSIAYYRGRPPIAFAAALLIAALTIWPLTVSVPITTSWTSWLRWRFGELLTATAAIIMLLALARRTFRSQSSRDVI